MNSVRTLLSCAAILDWPLQQFDVKNAFLHGDLEEEVYMEIPPGFATSTSGGKVCRLKKALYGLKQSPRQWYKRFDLFMVSHGYTRCEYDCCIYYRVLSDGSYIILALYDIRMSGWW